MCVFVYVIPTAVHFITFLSCISKPSSRRIEIHCTPGEREQKGGFCLNSQQMIFCELPSFRTGDVSAVVVASSTVGWPLKLECYWLEMIWSADLSRSSSLQEMEHHHSLPQMNLLDKTSFFPSGTAFPFFIFSLAFSFLLSSSCYCFNGWMWGNRGMREVDYHIPHLLRAETKNIFCVRLKPPDLAA